MALLFKVDGKEYRLASQPSEVTLGRFLMFLEDVEQYKPEIVTALEQAETLEAKAKVAEEYEGDAWTAQVQYYAEEIAFFSDIPESMLSELPILEVKRLHNALVHLITEVHNPKDLDRFECQGVEYYLPELGMKASTLGEFVQSAQWMHYARYHDKNDWSKLPEMIATLCRPKDLLASEKAGKTVLEALPLDEERLDAMVAERSEVFREHLTMDIAGYVSFFFRMSTRNWIADLESSVKAQ